MFGSAQKAPGASVALTALNVAVVRQSVFKRAAQQIAERRDNTTQDIVQAAENNRSRAKAVDAAVTSTSETNQQKQQQQQNNATSSKSDPEFHSPDFSAPSAAKLDIKV